MFSIIIPLYNKAHTIKQTLISVLSQTFQEFEIIIVNDGSTDNGVVVINECTNDLRLRIINQSNQGVSVARNRGIKESKYNYIAFLDGDDEWLPFFLEEIRAAIIKFPHAGAFGTSSYHKNIQTGISNDATLKKFKGKVTKVNCFLTPNLLPHTSAIVVNRNSLYKIDKELNIFPNGMRVCEDWACFYRLVLYNDLIYIGKPLGIRNNNVSGQITGLSENEKRELYPDVVRYYNLMSTALDLNLSIKQRQFLDLLKHEIRHRILGFIIKQDKILLDLFSNNLNRIYLSNFEFNLYFQLKYKYISVSIIYLHKILYKLKLVINGKYNI